MHPETTDQKLARIESKLDAIQKDIKKGDIADIVQVSAFILIFFFGVSYIGDFGKPLK